jgi:hypothetical protein
VEDELLLTLEVLRVDVTTGGDFDSLFGHRIGASHAVVAEIAGDVEETSPRGVGGSVLDIGHSRGSVRHETMGY